MKKSEERYRELCHDLAEITRDWIYEGQKGEARYPEFRPGFRGHVAKKLQELGYFKVTIKLGDIARLK